MWCEVFRWGRLEVNCAEARMDEVGDLLRSALVGLHGANASGRPLTARVTLCGETVEAGALHDSAATLRDDVRAIASLLSPALFVEKVRVEVTEPAIPGLVLGGVLGGMIVKAGDSP